jgi:CIC family chloride channel protein
MQLSNLFKRWSVTHSQKIILIAIVIGVASGLLGVALKFSVHFIFTFLTTHNVLKNWIYIFPFLGVLISYVILDIFFKGRVQKGLTGVLYSIARKSGLISPQSVWVNPVTSIITIGFGGSAGIEGPIVATTAAVGANLAEKFKLNYGDRILMISAGTAAGIASVFNAPIAGVMFAIEILLPDLSVATFIPVMISGAAGALCSRIILHEDILLNFSLLESFNYFYVPWYILLGFISGLISLHYIRVTHFIDSKMENSNHRWVKTIFGGVLLSAITFLFPPLLSEGSFSLKTLAAGDSFSIVDDIRFSIFSNNDYTLIAGLIFLLFFKPIAVALTINSGGNGGNFGPSLFMGAITGYSFSFTLQHLTESKIPLGNFSLVGMAGVLSGVMHAPLTAIFLIAEITGGYELFIPLLIVSSFSYLIAKHFEPHSVDTKKLALRKDMLTHDKDSNALLLMNMSKLIEKDILEIRPTEKLEGLIRAIKTSRRNLYAVVDKAGKFHGIVYFDDVKNKIFDPKLYKKIKVSEVLKKPTETLEVSDSMSTVVEKFDRTAYWNLPVTDKGKYIGFVSKSRIFDEYRRQIKNR